MAANFHLVQSLIKSLAIIEVLSETIDGMGVTDISERIGLNKSTVHRILTTLVHEGFVEQDQAKGCYHMSPKIFELARRILNNIRPAKVIAPHLERLAKVTGESARFIIIDDTHSRLIVSDEVLTSKPIQVRSHLGESLSLSESAAGKMFLACLTDEEIKEIMDSIGRKAVLPDEKASFSSLQRDLSVIREKGYAYETYKFEDEMICNFAAPILDEQGTIIAMIDVFAPAFRCSRELSDTIGNQVKEAAIAISRELGYLPEEPEE